MRLAVNTSHIVEEVSFFGGVQGQGPFRTRTNYFDYITCFIMFYLFNTHYTYIYIYKYICILDHFGMAVGRTNHDRNIYNTLQESFAHLKHGLRY